jgi:hypothetical protein
VRRNFAMRAAHLPESMDALAVARRAWRLKNC